MFQLLFKILYFIAILPVLIAIEGYKKLKKFMVERGYLPDWAYAWLVILILLLILVILFQYGYY